MLIRILKTLLLLAFTLWATMVAVDNILDYQSDFIYVQHVLAMDNVFKTNPMTYRAITDTHWQYIIYNIIIAWELFMALVCWGGFFSMLLALNKNNFQQRKTMAITGLSMILFLYAFGFMAIASGWFSIWQSKWSAQPTVMGMFSCVGITLIWLSMAEPK